MVFLRRPAGTSVSSSGSPPRPFSWSSSGSLQNALQRHELEQKFAHRDEVEHVVMEDLNEKVGISCAHVVVIDARDLTARYVSSPSPVAHV